MYSSCVQNSFAVSLFLTFRLCLIDCWWRCLSFCFFSRHETSGGENSASRQGKCEYLL